MSRLHILRGPSDLRIQNPVQDDDAESALGESVTESTASISSSILNYRTLHGRRYHSEIGNAHYWYDRSRSINMFGERTG